jgi:tripartite-type tricarboxylate transporter receptor subunit TctC
MNARRRFARLLQVLVLSALGAGAAAQKDDYPNKPIRYISPYPPGGSTSVIARLIGQQLTEAWGQQVVVDNRGGANTIIGTHAAVTARPDGYTLVSLGGTLAGNHWLAKTPYDALKDIAPIATVSSYENVLVVPPSLPVNTVADLVAMAKAKPDQLTYGTSSSGGPTHLLAELFNTVAGIKTRQIPYKGGGPAVVDLMGGHIHFFFSNPVNVASQVKGGRLRAIGVTGPSRIPAFPDVPTFTEQGLPAMTLTNWQGVGGPAGIPRPIIDRLSGEIRKLVARPDTKNILTSMGSEPFYNDPQQTAALIRADIAKYGKIIKDANIPVEDGARGSKR